MSNKVHEKPKIKNKESNFNTISAKRLYIPEFKEPKKSFKQFPPIQEYHPPEKKESKNAKVFSDINRRFEYLVRQSKASSSTIKEEDKLIINHLEVLKLFKEMEDLNIQYNKELKKNINLQNQTNSKEVIPKTQNPLTTEREIKKLKFEIKIANAKIQRLNNENSIPGYGTVRFDFFGCIDLPQLDHTIKRIYLNVEIQNDTYLKYSLITRGDAYLSRIQTTQWGKEYNDQNYDGMKKVYLIWILPQAAKKEMDK